ncbi:competence protein ComK [Peribacillus frigoritolerans]|uniref:competence protein ComK n=1 Tax=Peribacillus frigoritolerans TaxID=450367 RepID=UPI003DA0B6EA
MIDLTSSIFFPTTSPSRPQCIWLSIRIDYLVRNIFFMFIRILPKVADSIVLILKEKFFN